MLVGNAPLRLPWNSTFLRIPSSYCAMLQVKTAEPWILHDFGDRQFYGEHLRVLVCAFIRPETAFVSLEALIKQIHNDGAVASSILDHPRLAALASDCFLMNK